MVVFKVTYCSEENNAVLLEKSIVAYTESQALALLEIDPAQVFEIRRTSKCSTKNC